MLSLSVNILLPSCFLPTIGTFETKVLRNHKDCVNLVEFFLELNFSPKDKLGKEFGSSSDKGRSSVRLREFLNYEYDNPFH